METLLRIGLSNAVAALALTLVVVTIACLCRRPAVLHALWLLVLIKLVTPPLVWLPEPWPATVADAAPKVVVEAPAAAPADMPLTAEWAPADPSNEAAPVEAPPASDPSLAPVAEVDAAMFYAAAEPTPAATPAPAAPWWAVAVFGVWLTGALGWYALAVYRLQRFRRLLCYAVPAPESLRQRTQRLAVKLRLRRCPTVWLVPGRVAPMLWAAGGRPRILFPAELLSQIDVEQQNALLVHELAHLRRRDHWVRWLEFAAAGLYWWNPVLWFARRELREAEEQCCDAWVTSTLPDAGKTYATALLETLDFLSNAPHAAPLLASGVGRVSDLKRRLTMIMRGTTPRALSWRGLLAVLGLGALMLPLLPAWARAQAPAKAEPENADHFFVRFTDSGAVKAEASPEALEKAKAELKELEGQLAQKQAEVAALAAKVAAARQRIVIGDDGLKGRIIVEAAPESNYGALQDMLKRIQAAQGQGAAPEVIVVDRATGKIIMKMQGTPPQATPAPAVRWIVQPEAAPPQAAWPVPAQPGAPVQPPANPKLAVPATPAPRDADKRIDELEQKLKSILDEVEKLRHERKPGAPESNKDAPLHSYGTTPLENVPYVGRLFKSVGPEQEQAKALEAARAALEAQQQDLKARFEAEQAADAAVSQAKADVGAAEAALRQAEARQEVVNTLGKNGAARVDELKATQAEVALRRATLEQAKAVMDKVIADKRARQEEINAKVKAAEVERQSAETRIKQLEDLLRQKEKAAEETPRKP